MNIFDKTEGNILRSYPKDKKAMNSSHLINVINTIQPDTSLNENRDTSTHTPTNELNANCETSTHSSIENIQHLVPDNKQLYSWNPKTPPCGSVPSSKLCDDINEHESKLPI